MDSFSESESKTNDDSRSLRVLFLSEITGGGHGASAKALSEQFLIQYPGSTCEICNLWTEAGDFTSRYLINNYNAWAAEPWRWKLFYHTTNTRPLHLWGKAHGLIFLAARVKERIESFNPDVIVCVHPTMIHLASVQCREIGRELGKHIPFFTVITDLGSGSNLWFEQGVNRIYVPSEKLYQLGKSQGIQDITMVKTGLPIRVGFAVQAEKLGDRTTDQGKAYQREVREKLSLNKDKPMILVMGGGDGVGSLSKIADHLYAKLALQGIDATICVICGRNSSLKEDLETRDWANALSTPGRRRGNSHARRNFTRNPGIVEAMIADEKSFYTKELPTQGCVEVISVGFITNMPEYMVAADILVSKAGPGTIAEAASVGLPIMLTSFLPGQEYGNVDVVLESGFGDYCEDPAQIGMEVGCWLKNTELLQKLQQASLKMGNPLAGKDIVASIGSQTSKWMQLNEKHENDPVYADAFDLISKPKRWMELDNENSSSIFCRGSQLWKKTHMSKFDFPE